MSLTGFTKCVCTPDMYQSLIKIARTLGPLNLMPNAKKGDYTFDGVD
jgi:ribosomal protein L1